MTLRHLYAGPQYAKLETVAFERLARRVGDQPDRMLYLARNRDAERSTRDRWNRYGRPQSLTVDTFDGFVDRCHERKTFAGKEAHVDDPLRNRLVELAVERLDDPTNPLSSDGRLHSAGRCEQVEDLLSLVEFADLQSPDAIRERLREEGLDHQADTISAVAEAFATARTDLLGDPESKSLRAERYSRVLDSDTPLADRFPAVDAVVLGGFSLFSPLERQLVEQIVDAWPTVALLPQVADSDEAVGTDRGAERALGAYLDLDFERDYQAPGKRRAGRVAVSRGLFRHAGAADESPDAEHIDLVQPETVPEECRHVARDVRARLADGTPPEDIGIVLADGSAYHERLVETLDQYDVPATLSVERAFGETALGGVVDMLVALGREDPPLDAVTGLLANPLVTVGHDNPDLDQRELARVASRLTSRRLAAAYDHLDDDTAWTVQMLVDDARGLRNASLSDLPGAVDALLDQLGVRDAISDLPRSPRGRTEKQAIAKFDRTLETLALTDDVADLHRGDAVEHGSTSPRSSSTREDAVERLDRALRALSLDAETPRSDGHVLVCDLRDATPRQFDHAYVLGLTAGHFPSNPDRLAFTRPVNEAHEDFEQADVQQRARYHFGVLLASDASLALSVPERSLGGDPYVEADVVTELRRVADLEPEPVVPDDATPGCREDVQRSLGETFAHESTDDYAPHVDRCAEADTLDDDRRRRLHAGVACAAARASADLTPHDGQLSPETVATLHGPDAREPYSPSRLETYAACGFKYYTKEVLDIEEPDDVGLEPDARDRGGYVHDVLEHYYADLQAAPGDPVAVRGDRQEREAHLLDVALARLDDRFDAVEHSSTSPRSSSTRGDGDETAFHREWLVGVLAGLGDPDSNPYHGTDAVAAPERGLLARFLDHEFDEVGAATARPAWFEARVGRSRYGESLREAPVVVETPAGEVPVHGMVDRVDVVPGTEPTQAVVRDYKTGGTPAEADTLGGMKFQLPVYAHLVEGVLGDVRTSTASSGSSGERSEPDGVEVVGGSYYKVKPPNEVNHRKGLVASRANATWAGRDDVDAPLTRYGKPTFETHEAYRRFVTEEVPDRLGRIAEAIEAGHYHPTVLDPRDAGCRYCGYRDVCDVRSHRRRDVLAAIDEGDVPAYVPLAARDEDPADVLEVE